MIIGTLLILPTSFLAAAAAAMDLMDLYREAKDHDARYAAARAQFRAAQEVVPQARAGAAREVHLNDTVKRHRDRGLAGLPDFSSARRHRYRGDLQRPDDR